MDCGEFEFLGRKYVCVSDFGAPCSGCAFLNRDDTSCSVSKEKIVPWCDGIIFMEKQP